MNVVVVGTEDVADRYRGWHVLAAVERDDFPPPAGGGHGTPRPTGAATLPLWIVCDEGYGRSPQAVDEFRAHLAQFARRNGAGLRASQVVINLLGAPRPLPGAYPEVVEDVFRESRMDRSVRKVVIYARQQP